MFILFVSKSNYTSAFQPGRRMELPRSLAARGHRIGLFSASYSWKEQNIQSPHYDPLRLIRIGKTPFLMSLIYTLVLFKELAQILLASSAKPDVVIIDYSSVLACLPLALLSRLGVIHPRFVLDVRSPPVEIRGMSGRLKEWEYRLAIGLAKQFYSGITVITPALRDDIAKAFHMDLNRIGVWTSGASLDTFDPSSRKIPDDLAPFQDKFVILHHGVLTSHRGLREAIQAMKLLEGKYPDIVLLLIGNGEAKSELREMVHALNLENRVCFHDAVPYPSIPDYIACADIGLIPLPDICWWRVSSPQKLMEYLAMEKPVIVSDIPAHRSILKNSDCAIYLSSIEPETIVDAIINFYNRRGELNRLGRSGRYIIEKEFSWDAQAGKLEAYLQRINTTA